MSADLQTHIQRVRRERVPVVLVRLFGWYRALGPERRHAVDTRIAIVCGNGLCTPEAYALARLEIQDMEKEPTQPKTFQVNAGITREEDPELHRPRIITGNESDALREFMRAHAGKAVLVTIQVF